MVEGEKRHRNHTRVGNMRQCEVRFMKTLDVRRVWSSSLPAVKNAEKPARF